MPRFHVYITEQVHSFISVDADTADEARRMVLAGDYNSEDQSDPDSDGLTVTDVELSD